MSVSEKSSSSAKSLAGQKVGEHWTLGERLGRGGIGHVYEALHSDGEQKAAIKLLRKAQDWDDEAKTLVDRFYHEAQILRRLQHPGIIEVYDFGFEEEVGFYLVMELLQGDSLLTYMQKNKGLMPRKLLYHVIHQVCDAMAFAHERDIVHRDLKPEHIFLIGDPRGPEEDIIVKVFDFGIARFHQEEDEERLTQQGVTLGTPRYLSPEQTMGIHIDLRSDIYTLCVIIFELLTRRRVFQVEGAFQLMTHHAYVQAPTLSEARPDLDFPELLESLLIDGLAKDPKERPQSMEELKRRLHASLRDYLDGKVPEPKKRLGGAFKTSSFYIAGGRSLPPEEALAALEQFKLEAKSAQQSPPTPQPKDRSQSSGPPPGLFPLDSNEEIPQISKADPEPELPLPPSPEEIVFTDPDDEGEHEELLIEEDSVGPLVGDVGPLVEFPSEDLGSEDLGSEDLGSEEFVSEEQTMLEPVPDFSKLQAELPVQPVQLGGLEASLPSPKLDPIDELEEPSLDTMMEPAPRLAPPQTPPPSLAAIEPETHDEESFTPAVPEDEEAFEADLDTMLEPAPTLAPPPPSLPLASPPPTIHESSAFAMVGDSSPAIHAMGAAPPVAGAHRTPRPTRPSSSSLRAIPAPPDHRSPPGPPQIIEAHHHSKPPTMMAVDPYESRHPSEPPRPVSGSRSLPSTPPTPRPPRGKRPVIRSAKYEDVLQKEQQKPLWLWIGVGFGILSLVGLLLFLILRS